MSWNEVSAGVHQRPLSVSEKLLASVIVSEQPPTREPILIHVVANFEAPVLTEKATQAFKYAWKALRLLKSPDIATTFDDRYKRYKVPSPEELEAWLDETFIVAQTGTSVQTAMRNRRLRLQLLPDCFILPRPTEDGTFKGSLVLFISHWRIEASGCFKIINQLFDYASDLLNGTSTREALSNRSLGSEIRLLTPALEDILMPNQTTTLEAKTRVEKHFANYYSQLPCIDFPIQGSLPTTPSSAKVNQRIYSPISTSSLVNACRMNGITVTSGIHSAYLGAMWHIAEPSKRDRSFACIMPAQVRKRLAISSPYREQGCWSASQMLFLAVPAGQDFLTRARDLRQQYRLADQDTWLYEDMRETSERNMEDSAKELAEADKPVALPYITSMGVLDGNLLVAEHGAFEIESVTVWADPTGPGLVLGLWTFRGRLNIQISWNAAFHGDNQIREVLHLMDKTLAMALGVEMEVEEAGVTEI